MAKRFPWKSSIRKLTASIQESLDRIDGDLIAIAATKKGKRPASHELRGRRWTVKDGS